MAATFHIKAEASKARHVRSFGHATWSLSSKIWWCKKSPQQLRLLVSEKLTQGFSYQKFKFYYYLRVERCWLVWRKLINVFSAKGTHRAFHFVPSSAK